MFLCFLIYFLLLWSKTECMKKEFALPPVGDSEEFEDMKTNQTTNRVKLVVDCAIPFLEGLFDPWAEVVRLPGSDFTPEVVHDADALVIRTRTRCTEALLATSRVKLIATATIGFDHIDMDYCRRAGIEVVTAAGCNARGVLQWVAAVLVAFSRKQGWRPEERTLGIVGVGHVGSLVKEYAEHWGFRVLCCDPPRAIREGFPSRSVEELADRCDILTFHTPLDDTTYHLCGTALLQRISPKTILLNASRGAVVDNEALLRSGQPCALDVWEGEPHLSEALLARAEVATSHIAGYSLQGKANASAMVVAAVARHFGWSLTTWYPAEVTPTQPQKIDWPTLCETIDHYFDVAKESAYLKQYPTQFEAIRDHYPYRKEYF